MADLIKKVKIKKQDGTYTDYIPIGAEAKNVDCSDGESVQLKLNKKPYYYNSVADMEADTKLKAGDMAVTLGYYEVNDGGGAEYRIRIITNDDTINSKSIIQINNGQNQLIAELVNDEEINICQIGAKGNGINDDSIFFEFALNNYNTINIPNKTFLINDVITCTKSNVTIKGLSLNSKINILSDSSIAKQLVSGHGFNFSNVSNINISNIYFEDITQNKSRFSYNIRFSNSDNINISGIEINGNCGTGLFFLNCNNSIIKDSYIHDTLADGIHIQRGSKYFTIDNCKFYNTHDDCIGFVTHAGEEYGKCKRLLVTNCKMMNTLVTGSGVCCDGSDDVTIKDCYITQTILGGIRSNRIKESTENTYFYPTNIKIIDNIIESCGTQSSSNRSSIISNQGGSMDIIGNTIKNAYGLAIYLPGVLGDFNIKDNLILNCSSGISISDQTTVAFDTHLVINIDNNIINGISSTYPLFVTTSGTIISDDKVMVNVFNNILTHININNEGGYALSLNSIKNLKCDDNIISDYNGINLYSMSSTNVLSFSNNIPRQDMWSREYIGTKKMQFRGEAPTVGNIGDVVWNWNPANGTAFWICTTASTNNSNAVYKAVKWTS